MFEFFKYARDELSGVDHDERVKAIKEKKAAKDSGRIILSKSVKVAIYAFGGLFLIVALLSVSLLKRTGHGIEIIIPYVLLSLLDVGIMVLASIKKKSTEIAAIIGILFFIGGLFFLM